MLDDNSDKLYKQFANNKNFYDAGACCEELFFVYTVAENKIT